MIGQHFVALAMYVGSLAAVGDVPPEYAVDAYQAAHARDVSPYLLGAYLISEHRGAYPTDKCSSAGACGLYQITAGWVDHCGYKHDRRDEPAVSADLAACVLAYSRESHADCGPDLALAPVAIPGPAVLWIPVPAGRHDWRAHVKCGPGGRHDCRRPVDRWIKIEGDVYQVANGIETWRW